MAGSLRETREEADRRIRQEQALHEVAIALLAGTAREDVLRAHLQRVADALGVDAVATVDGSARDRRGRRDARAALASICRAPATTPPSSASAGAS